MFTHAAVPTYSCPRRNRHPNGTYELQHQLGLHFATPAWVAGSDEKGLELMKSFIYFTQVCGLNV